MNLAMENGFGGVGFTEMNEQEMILADGGELFPELMDACEFLFVGAVSTTFGAVGMVAGPIGAVGAGYAGSIVGQGLWDLMFE